MAWIIALLVSLALANLGYSLWFASTAAREPGGRAAIDRSVLYTAACLAIAVYFYTLRYNVGAPCRGLLAASVLAIAALHAWLVRRLAKRAGRRRATESDETT